MIEIKDKKECCGCSACVQICPKQCIHMEGDAEGFMYPVVDTAVCVACGLCERVCPMLHAVADPKKPLKVFAAKNMDETVRKASSSGAVFTPLAERIIRQEGVVFGARFDKDWNVEHAYTENPAGLAAFRGSKYLQSRMGCSYIQVKEMLRNGKQVLFSGTPCQIAALNRFLGREYQNLVTVEVLCHGVPSSKVWQRYLADRKKENHCQEITGINFRNKKTGWQNYSITIEFENGRVYEMRRKKDPYFRGFLRNLCLRPSCYDCKCKNGRSGSDLTIADYWNIRNVRPDYDDDRGVSSVLVNTEKGLLLWQAISGKLDFIETDYDDCIQVNKGFSEHVPVPSKRQKFLKKMAAPQRKSLGAVLFSWWKSFSDF